jgi:hypothetical protein
MWQHLLRFMFGQTDLDELDRTSLAVRWGYGAVAAMDGAVFAVTWNPLWLVIAGLLISLIYTTMAMDGWRHAAAEWRKRAERAER